MINYFGLSPMPKTPQKIDTSEVNNLFEKFDQGFSSPNQGSFQNPNKLESPDIIPKFTKSYRIDDVEIQGDLKMYRKIQEQKKIDFTNRSAKYFKQPDFVKSNYKEDMSSLLNKYENNKGLKMSPTENIADYKLLKKYAGFAGIEMRGNRYGYNSIRQKVNEIRDQINDDIRELYPETKQKLTQLPQEPNMVKKQSNEKTKLKPYQNQVQTLYSTNMG